MFLYGLESTETKDTDGLLKHKTLEFLTRVEFAKMLNLSEKTIQNAKEMDEDQTETQGVVDDAARKGSEAEHGPENGAHDSSGSLPDSIANLLDNMSELEDSFSDLSEERLVSSYFTLLMIFFLKFRIISGLHA